MSRPPFSHLLVEPPAEWVAAFCRGEFDCVPPVRAGPQRILLFLSSRASTRTRLSGLLAANDLGLLFHDLPWESFYGNPTVHAHALANLATETLSMWSLGVAAIVARVPEQQYLRQLASLSSVPVVNGCTELWHPLQALADLRTLRHAFGRLEGLRVAFVGNGAIPTGASLARVGTRLGLDIVFVGPPGYPPRDELLALPGPGTVRLSTSLADGLSAVDAIYLDEWFYRAPNPEEATAFGAFRITEERLTRFAPSSAVLHCLPHGDEVEAAVLVGHRSLVLEQVANRRGALVAVLSTLLSAAPAPGWT